VHRTPSTNRDTPPAPTIMAQHPRVQAAVAELQRRKERLGVAEGLAAAFDATTQGGRGVARWVDAMRARADSASG